MRIPGFTAAVTPEGSRGRYRLLARPADEGQVIAQSRITCAFKAGRLAGRCLQLGYDHHSCMATAADFNDFCNLHDL